MSDMREDVCCAVGCERTPQEWALLRDLHDSGVLTERAYTSLAWGMWNLYDAYPYRALGGRCSVWARDRRWTVEEWNTECSEERLAR